MRKFSNLPKYRAINEQEITLNLNGEQAQNAQQSPNTQEQNTEQDTQSTKIEQNSEPKKAMTVVQLFSKLFESREMSHIYHLQANNNGAYPNHKALEEYYDDIVDMIDDLIESYQGQYDIVEGYETINPSGVKDKTPLEYFIDLANCVKENRKSIPMEDSHLHGNLDEIVTLIYKTIYKLKYLSK
jgi:hypothetical protein